jgi:hypothetical protein
MAGCPYPSAGALMPTLPIGWERRTRLAVESAIMAVPRRSTHPSRADQLFERTTHGVDAAAVHLFYALKSSEMLIEQGRRTGRNSGSVIGAQGASHLIQNFTGEHGFLF